MRPPVLLARPHDFVVSDTQAALERSGFAVVRCDSSAELDARLQQPLSGVVISTAVSSVMPLTVAQVFERVRRAQPRIPVAFSSLSTCTAARDTVTHELPALAKAQFVLSLAVDPKVRLATPETFVCLHRAGLIDGSVDTLLKLHFGGEGLRS